MQLLSYQILLLLPGVLQALAEPSLPQAGSLCVAAGWAGLLTAGHEVNHWFHNWKRPQQEQGRKQNQWLEVTKPRAGDGVREAVAGQGSLALPVQEILEVCDLEGKCRGGIWTSHGLGQQWHQQDTSPNTSLPVGIHPCK